MSRICNDKKIKTYYLTDRLTTEQAFSDMKVVKARLHNTMEDDFLANSLDLI
jgi:hypothetical protein